MTANDPTTSPSVSPILKVERLSKTFHSKGKAPVQVLHDVSFDILPGEFIAIV